MLGLLVAATWTIGAFASGPIPFRPIAPCAWRTVVGAVVVGVVAFVVFLVAYLVARHLRCVGPRSTACSAKADAGPTALVLVVALVNGAGEELFFRGALHAALEPHRPASPRPSSTSLVTVATGNVALVVAAVVMGALFSLERLSTAACWRRSSPT